MLFDTLFGADPEVFVFDGKTIIPPVAFKEDFGIKYKDKTILDGDDWKIIEDGAATEINLQPANNIDSIMGSIVRATQGLQSFVRTMGNFSVITQASAPFDSDKYWKGRGESFRDCVRFGCDPDLDIYSNKYSQEVCAEDINYRFGGGHIHMQAPIKNQSLFEDVYYHATRLMDILVGNAGVAIYRTDDHVKLEKERLKFYGRPGRIRLQNYPSGMKGIEYRVPSNFWIKNSSHATTLLTLMNCVYNLSQHPSDAAEFLTPEFCTEAPNYILTFDQKNAKNLLIRVLDMLCTRKYIDFTNFKKILETTSERTYGY